VNNLREYCRPSSVDEAVRLKREMGERAVYLAGGSDLLVHRPAQVERAIDIRHAGIGYAERAGDWFVIGGGALLRDAEEAMKSVCGGMLRRALRETAPWLIRNAATVAGNIANASPAADAVPALMALDAQLRLVGHESDEVPLESILQAPHRTSLGDRLIREIRIPVQSADRQGFFIKLARSKSDIALVNGGSLLRSRRGSPTERQNCPGRGRARRHESQQRGSSTRGRAGVDPGSDRGRTPGPCRHSPHLGLAGISRVSVTPQ